jgi:RNA polymerase sigma factor (sigma-70 family)
MDGTQLLEWDNTRKPINEARFLQIIDPYQEIIGRICRLYADTNQERDFLYRQIIFQLWKSAPAFIEQGKFSSWIYQVALTTSIASSSDKRSNPMNPPKHSADLRIQRDLDDPKEDLITALKKLPDDDKAIITLYLEDLDYAVIAEITGLTETIIGVKVNRIKKKIQQLLNKSREQYPLKSIWRNIYSVHKTHTELKLMLSDNAHPIIKSIRKWLFNNIFPYILSKSLAKGLNIKKSLEDNLAKLKSHVIVSIISRLMVLGCLVLFGKLIFVTGTVMYITLALVILLFSLQLLFLIKLYNKKIRQMKAILDRLKRQKEFVENYNTRSTD